MPKTKQRPKPTNSKQLLKTKLDNFKQQKQSRIMENQLNQLPKVRQFPAWSSNAQLSITGKELELIANFMDQAGAATMAYQNIVNRGLIEGTIDMKYEKLNADATAYEPMSTEEAAPYRAEFESLVKQAKEIAQQAVEQVKQEADLVKSQENLPQIDAILDPTGQPAQKSKIITMS